jgi:hypothetical protein
MTIEIMEVSANGGPSVEDVALLDDDLISVSLPTSALPDHRVYSAF